MSDKSPESYSGLFSALPFVYAIFWSLIAGTVRYFNKVSNRGIQFRIFSWATECLTSAFVGMIAFVLCDTANLSIGYTLVIVSVAAHMGTDALRIMANNFLRSYGYVKDDRRVDEKEES